MRLKNHYLPDQIFYPRLPNLHEAKFKADKIKTHDFEITGVEITYKFHSKNPKVAEIRQSFIKTLWDKLWLIIVKQSFSFVFQFVVLFCSRFLP